MRTARPTAISRSCATASVRIRSSRIAGASGSGWSRRPTSGLRRRRMRRSHASRARSLPVRRRPDRWRARQRRERRSERSDRAPRDPACKGLPVPRAARSRGKRLRAGRGEARIEPAPTEAIGQRSDSASRASIARSRGEAGLRGRARAGHVEAVRPRARGARPRSCVAGPIIRTPRTRIYWRGEVYFARGEYLRAAEQFEACRRASAAATRRPTRSSRWACVTSASGRRAREGILGSAATRVSRAATRRRGFRTRGDDSRARARRRVDELRASPNWPSCRRARSRWSRLGFVLPLAHVTFAFAQAHRRRRSGGAVAARAARRRRRQHRRAAGADGHDGPRSARRRRYFPGGVAPVPPGGTLGGGNAQFSSSKPITGNERD